MKTHKPVHFQLHSSASFLPEKTNIYVQNIRGPLTQMPNVKSNKKTLFHLFFH